MFAPGICTLVLSLGAPLTGSGPFATAEIIIGARAGEAERRNAAGIEHVTFQSTRKAHS